MLVSRLIQKIGVEVPPESSVRWGYSGDDRSVSAEFCRDDVGGFSFDVSERETGNDSSVVCEGRGHIDGDEVLFESPEALSRFDFFCEAVSGMAREPG